MIYFIKPVGVDGPVKIGYTACSAEARLVAFQVGSPLILEVAAVIKSGSRKEEMRLHLHFQDAWSHGEWFHATEELNKAIEYYASGGTDLGVYSDARDPMDFVLHKAKMLKSARSSQRSKEVHAKIKAANNLPQEQEV